MTLGDAIDGIARVKAIVRDHMLAIAALAMLVMAVFQPPLLGAAERQNDAVLKSAVAAYAILRTINATVSTAKETTLGLGVVGSVQTKPAMVLDPLDDTVRRVADVMFAVAAVSGFLALAMAPVCKLGAIVAGVGLAGLYLVRFGIGGSEAWTRALRSLATLGLALGLVLPVGFGAGGWIGESLTADRLAEAMARLEASETAISVETAALTVRPVVEDPAQGAPAADGAGLFDGTLRWLGDGAQAAMAGASGLLDQARAVIPSLSEIAERGEAILTSSIDIMAVYAMRLLVFPLLSVFILYTFARAALSGTDPGGARS